MTAFSTAAEIAAAVQSGAARPEDIIVGTLARIEANNSRLGAFTSVVAERATAQAAKVASQIAAGKVLPLAGVPFGVKNLFDIAGVVTVAGSKINRDNAPALADSPLIERLEAEGAICVGALNMGEYAYDFTGENIHDGPARNPHDTEHMAGGSSGGPASAVAGGLVPLSLGSDTNGSIRVPAAFCGIFGLKPTYGRLTRRGSFPFVASLDHVGPFARSVEDLALSYDAMQGFDEADPAMTKRPLEKVAGRLDRGGAGLRIAVADGYFAGNGDAREAVRLAAEGLEATRQVTIPETPSARAAAFLITMAEGAELHLERLQTRSQDFDPEVRDRLMAGAMLPAAWIEKAQKIRRVYRDSVLELFNSLDVILAPTTPMPAPKIGQRTARFGGVEMPVRQHMGMFTQPFSFIGLPVVAVPIWIEGQHLPFGVQVIAAPWREDVALRVARQLEKSGIAKAPVARDFASA